MIIAAIVTVIILCFCLVVFFGAPYLPTHSRQVEIALDMLALEKGETMLELGCGDGKVIIAAARRGWRVVGYELNPVLVAVCWLRTRRYRAQVRLVWGDYWRMDWPDAAAIYGFILPKYMSKLNSKIIHDTKKPLRLASYAFAIPEKVPSKERKGVFLYEYN